MPRQYQPVTVSQMEAIKQQLAERRALEQTWFETFRETQGYKPRRDPAEMSDDDLHTYIDRMRNL